MSRVSIPPDPRDDDGQEIETDAARRRPYRPNAGLPAALKWFVPEPEIGLLGVKPFVPLAPGAPCDLCHGVVRDRPATIEGEAATVVVCLQCNRMDDRWEPLVARQLAEAVAAEDAETRLRRDEEWRDDAAKGFGPDDVLSEVDRRRIWLGQDGPAGRPCGAINPARSGREFLTAIGQPPDWSLILDRSGTPIGRVEFPPEAEFEPEYEAAPHADPGLGGDVWNAAIP